MSQRPWPGLVSCCTSSDIATEQQTVSRGNRMRIVTRHRFGAPHLFAVNLKKKVTA
jgi:hypothetical protein